MSCRNLGAGPKDSTLPLYPLLLSCLKGVAEQLQSRKPNNPPNDEGSFWLVRERSISARIAGPAFLHPDHMLYEACPKPYDLNSYSLAALK